MVRLTKAQLNKPTQPGFIFKSEIEIYERISRGTSTAINLTSSLETTDRESRTTRTLNEGSSFSLSPIDERSAQLTNHNQIEALIQETGFAHISYTNIAHILED